MPNEIQHYLTPVVRIIQGDAFVPQTKDKEGNLLVYKTGAKQGQPREKYFIAGAVSKQDPEAENFIGLLWSLAMQTRPNMFDPNTRQCLRNNFSFKYVDGDSTEQDENGKRFCDKEGFPGHYVVFFSNGFPPAVGTQGMAQLITDKERVKRGYYVRVLFEVASNDSDSKPGIILNHRAIEFIGAGEVIHSGPDLKQAFGQQAVGYVPQGMTQAPVDNSGGNPAMPPPPAQQPQGQAAPPANPAPPAGNPAPPAANPAPPAGNPAPPPPAQDYLSPQTNAEIKYKHPNGTLYTEQELLSSGWTQDAIAGLPQA